MPRLVTLDIVADDAVAGDVFRGLDIFFVQLHGKQGIKLLNEGFIATVELHQTGNVVGHKQAVSPGVTLDESLPVSFQGIKLFAPVARSIFGTHELDGIVPVVVVKLGTFAVFLRFSVIAGDFRQLRNGPVVVGKFQGLGNGVITPFIGDVAQLNVAVQGIKIRHR